MVEVLLAGVLGMVISILSGPKFIDFLRKNEFGQQIREEGPKGHVVKQGTPAMGGLLIMISMAVPFLIFSERTVPAVTASPSAARRSASSTTGRKSPAGGRWAFPAAGSSSGWARSRSWSASSPRAGWTIP
jgi:hypothetical protein